MYSLSNKASTDLDSILDYSIINFGTEVMLKYHKSIEKCFEILNENTDLVFYKKISKDILIIRILHKSMDAPEQFN